MFEYLNLKMHIHPNIHMPQVIHTQKCLFKYETQSIWSERGMSLKGNNSWLRSTHQYYNIRKQQCLLLVSADLRCVGEDQVRFFYVWFMLHGHDPAGEINRIYINRQFLLRPKTSTKGGVKTMVFCVLFLHQLLIDWMLECLVSATYFSC